MSANRITKRLAYKASQSAQFTHWAAVRRGEPSRYQTWHDYAIAAGHRRPEFQKNIRAARAEHGLRPTSSDMCRVHGRRIG